MHKTLYFFVLLSFSVHGQTTDNKIKTEIKNTRTEKHINIPGTRLYIIAPPGFSVSSTFIGLQKNESTIFNIYDLVGGNFYTNAATFSRSAFEQKGIRVFDFQEIKVNGYPAKYISMQGDMMSKTIAIVFGDTTFSTMIITAYPVMNNAIENDIVKSLNTIWYDPQKKIDPFETANFSLDDKNSKFKFFQYSASLYVYSISGKEYDGKEEPFVIVTQLPKDGSMTPRSIAQMMMGKAQQYGLTNPEIKNESTDKLNGYDTYRAEVHGKMQGNNSLTYHCVVAKGDIAIVIQGIAKKDIEDNLKEFKQLVNTVRIK